MIETPGATLKAWVFPSPFLPASSRLQNRTCRVTSPKLSRGRRLRGPLLRILSTTSISIDESIVKSAAQGVSLGVGVRVISGERTGYAYSDDLDPEKIRKAARVAAYIAAGPAQVEKTALEETAKHNLYPVLTAPTETASPSASNW